MTNTEWLCLQLAAKIEAIAGFKADEDLRKLRQIPGDFSETIYTQYRAQRKTKHIERLKSYASAAMEKILYDMGGAS